MRRFGLYVSTLGVAWLLAIASHAQADLVISIENETVLPGGTAEVGIYATNSTPNTTVDLTGFNLPIDIKVDGQATLPTGFTLNGPPLINVVYSNTGFEVPLPQISFANVDAILTGNGSNLRLGTTPIKLMDLAIDVATTVPVGTVVPIRILIPGNGFSGLFSIASVPTVPTLPGLTTSLFVAGSISVVPEPNAFALLTVVALSAAFCVIWRNQAASVFFCKLSGKSM